VFVNSMSDLFHEDVPDAFIDQVFAVMALAPRHTFQILTKRADRMRMASGRDRRVGPQVQTILHGQHHPARGYPLRWPLPNVWLGVSVEDQKHADERIPLLLQTPAAVRFVSAEPLLGTVNLERYLWQSCCGNLSGGDYLNGEPPQCCCDPFPPLDWVIVGGESGPGARPFNVAWARSIARQCKEAKVPVFVKQLGRDVRDRNDAGFLGEEPSHWPERIDILDRVEHDLDGTRDGYQGAPVRIHLDNKKGGDPQEWPADLRIREFPQAVSL
jgi:protein gp37